VVDRRGLLLGGGIGLALGGVVSAAGAPVRRDQDPGGGPSRSARDFGAVGDGRADDTAALQKALDATLSGSEGMLVIPPGTYRVTRTLRVAPTPGAAGNMVRQSGILAHGAHVISEIADGGNVFEFLSRSTIRFVLIEGLDILGSGHEGHGIYVECDRNDAYFYNFCLRDVVIQDCGGDGCHMIGNVFEGQIINTYLRKNAGNGLTLGHGTHGGILSAIHVFGCVFGDNARHGVAMVNNCYDASFHGCYFLLNGQFGLTAENGCTLLSNCGFENNHTAARNFDAGDAGIALNNFGTLVGCTAYSLFNQTGLLRAYTVGRLVLVGCTGGGDGSARRAGLARLGGKHGAGITLIGCTGAVEYTDGLDGVEIGGALGGIGLGAHWQSPNLARLGEYRLWVDAHGRLRLKKGTPSADEDGTTVGA
jgi:Pectate lyase superfamily protein/Right handed beta helix region